MIIDREDGVITLCEMKYSTNKFSITKVVARQLANKIQVFSQQTRTQKQITVAMITTCGLKPSIWTAELVDHGIQLTDIIEQA